MAATENFTVRIAFITLKLKREFFLRKRQKKKDIH